MRLIEYICLNICLNIVHVLYIVKISNVVAVYSMFVFVIKLRFYYQLKDYVSTEKFTLLLIVPTNMYSRCKFSNVNGGRLSSMKTDCHE